MSSDRLSNCVWSLEQLHAHLDGQLDPAQELALRNHLDACPECRNLAIAASESVQGLRQVPSLRCPERVLVSLRRLGPPPSEHARRRSRSVSHLRLVPPVRWALLAASAALVLIIALRPRPSEPSRNQDPSPLPPVVAPNELKQAERQVKIAFTLLRAVGQRSASLATEEVVTQGVLTPARKLSLALLNSSRVSRGFGSSLPEKLDPEPKP